MDWVVLGAEELLGGEARKLKASIEETGSPLPAFAPYVYRVLLEQKNANKETLAGMLAKLRIKELTAKVGPDESVEPFPAEVAFEGRFLTSPGKKPYGIPYEGALLQASLRPLLKQAGFSRLSSLPVVLLPDLLATFEPSDRRYHLRMNVLGFPALISIPGIVLAPAKPREYYLLKRSGMDPAGLNRAFKGLFIDHGDPRLPLVVSGLALQALAYARTGNVFCDDAGCSLHNAHWHHELIALYGQDEAQNTGLSQGIPLCSAHSGMVKDLKLTP